MKFCNSFLLFFSGLAMVAANDPCPPDAEDMKCPYQHPDRLYREEGHSLVSCRDKCASTMGCDYFSVAEDADHQYAYVCMGCSDDANAQPHEGFNLHPLHCDLGGGALDDPHFKTWTGQWYDYMGECSLVLLHAPNFAPDKVMDIHIRTKIRYDYSYIESAVLKIGEETFEVGSFGDYFLNGVRTADLSSATLSGFPIKHSVLSEKSKQFEIVLEGDEKIVFKTFKDMVSVNVEHAQIHQFQGTMGMMGDLGGAMIGRDGVTVFEDPNLFADEWQVRSDEGMFFQSTVGPQHPQKCMLPDPTQKQQRRLGESIVLEAATKACAHWPEEIQAGCVHDVMAIGDLDLASVGAF